MASRTDHDDTAHRVNAILQIAQTHAHAIGEDNATAASDILCAFVAACISDGVDPAQAIEFMLPDAALLIDELGIEMPERLVRHG